MGKIISFVFLVLLSKIFNPGKRGSKVVITLQRFILKLFKIWICSEDIWLTRLFTIVKPENVNFLLLTIWRQAICLHFLARMIYGMHQKLILSLIHCTELHVFQEHALRQKIILSH